MKFQSLFLLYLLILAFNCSKSDDSDGDQGQLPPQSFFLIVDEGTENEVTFSGYDDEVEASIPCQHYGVGIGNLESDNLTITNFSIAFTYNLLEAPGSMQSGEYFDNGDGGIACEAFFRIDGNQFSDVSGTFTLTSFSGSNTEDNAIGSGSANLIMRFGSGTNAIMHTIRVEFENIKVIYFGGC